MLHDFSGKTALVTGASRGLGAAIACKLAACGAKTAINYFGSPQKARHVLEQIRRQGGSAEIFQADVRDESAVSSLVGQVTSQFGPIDILVVNATGPQPFIKLDDLTWRHCLDQLEFFVKSPVLLAKAVLPSMKERRHGRIINIGSEVFERRAQLLELRLGQGSAARSDPLLGDGTGAVANHGQPRRSWMDSDRAARRRFPGIEGCLRRRRADEAHGPTGRCGRSRCLPRFGRRSLYYGTKDSGKRR